jgi:hypothetical protein
MKTVNHTGDLPSSIDASRRFCRELIAAVGKLKVRLLVRYERTLPGRRHLIQQAIADAEEMAWRTPFPHLFLPDFAEVRLAEIIARREPAFARAA